MDGKLTSRLESIDFLRGVAALAVVFVHAIQWSEKEVPSLWFKGVYNVLDLGRLGVPMFFVISGFCIHLRWAKNIAKSGKAKIDFWSFWRRRVHRLYPPYLVVLCICMGMLLLAWWMGREVALLRLYPEPRGQWMLADFISHVFMLHGLHPVFDRAGGNVPFWTLAREEYFYLLYFPLILGRRYWGLLTAVLLVLVSGLAFPLLMRYVVAPQSNWWNVITTSAIVLWIQWCLGMVAAEFYCGIRKCPSWAKAFWLVPVWFAIALVSETYFPLWSPLAWGLTFFTLLNACVDLEKKKRWPEARLVKWLSGVGVFSYSLYLVHNPIRAVMKQALPFFRDTTNPYILVFVIAPLVIVCSYFAAKLFFRLVESRFLNSHKVDPEVYKVREELPATSNYATAKTP